MYTTCHCKSPHRSEPSFCIRDLSFGPNPKNHKKLKMHPKNIAKHKGKPKKTQKTIRVFKIRCRRANWHLPNLYGIFGFLGFSPCFCYVSHTCQHFLVCVGLSICLCFPPFHLSSNPTKEVMGSRLMTSLAIWSRTTHNCHTSHLRMLDLKTR